MFTQCVQYMRITIFQKITKTLDFTKVVNFHRNWKCGKMDVSLFAENDVRHIRKIVNAY